MKTRLLTLCIVPLALGLALARPVAAAPAATPAIAHSVTFIPDIQLSSSFTCKGMPDTLEAGFSGIFLITESSLTAEPPFAAQPKNLEARSCYVALCCTGGYAWVPASFVARATLRLGNPRTGSLGTGTVIKKLYKNDIFRFYLQAEIGMRLLEQHIGPAVLTVDISTRYTIPRGAIPQTGQTLLDCVEAGIMVGCRFPGGRR